jgi:hypothetical protein
MQQRLLNVLDTGFPRARHHEGREQDRDDC